MFEFPFLQKVRPNANESLGIEVLKSRAFFTEAHWYWIGVGALIGYVLLFNAGFVLALTYLNGGCLFPIYSKNLIMDQKEVIY